MPELIFNAVRLEPEDDRQLRAVASLNGRSISAEIRAAVRRHLVVEARRHARQTDDDPDLGRGR